MSQVVVLGTGGHARSVLDALIDAGAEVIGCVGQPPNGPLQVPYLGSDDVLTTLQESGRSAVIAVGDADLRQTLFSQARRLGFDLPVIMARTAYKSMTAEIGAGSVVLHGAVVGPYTRLGVGCIVNTGASVDHDNEIGDFVHIAPGAHLAGAVHVGDRTMIGAGATVIPGMRVGQEAMVGAGATVVSQVGDGVTVVGTPAKNRSRLYE